MTTTTTVALSKLLLLACDQSYFDGTHPVSTQLQSLDDKASVSGDDSYSNSSIYRTISPFDADGIQSGYSLYRTIERLDIGAKLVIYKSASNDVIVAFGGTDGTNLQDWVANTQNVGWKQWAALKQDVSPSNLGLFGVLAQLGDINTINFTGQSLGGALAQYAAYEYVKQEAAPLPNGDPSIAKGVYHRNYRE